MTPAQLQPAFKHEDCCPDISPEEMRHTDGVIRANQTEWGIERFGNAPGFLAYSDRCLELAVGSEAVAEPDS
jgi:hypothetical protein